MPRMKATKREELESFWRSHLDGWRDSDLNQREYCEAHGLPLKRFGNWRAKFKSEGQAVPRKLLYRRGGGLSHMISPMTKEIPPAPASYIPSACLSGQNRRRNFSEADKRRIVEEACREGASISGTARKYGIAARVVFRWRQELAEEAKAKAPAEPVFLQVTLTDAPDQSGAISLAMPASEPAAVIIERTAPGIEVELIGGRRVRFERDVDPETVLQLISVLEGAGT